MKNTYLIFQLYGAMASWGDIACGESRHTTTHPGKSAIIGLIAAALGIKRNEEDIQKALADSIVFALKVYNTGSLLRDFHTSQVPPKDRKRQYLTRAQELGISDKLNTILSWRDYVCDPLVQVSVQVGEDSNWSLLHIQQALLKPKFVLYLGRKACPIGSPLHPQIIEAKGLKSAFDTYGLHPCGLATEKADNWLPKSEAYYCWEQLEEGDDELTATKTVRRHDKPVSRKRWQFAVRDEMQCPRREGLMFFSRVKLEINQLPDHDFKDLFNGQKYREHQLLWKLFDSEKRHFLFRREVNKQHNPGANYNLKGAPIYYIVSHDEPQPYPGFSTETKPYNPSLQVGQQLAFTLRANPVVAKKQEGKKTQCPGRCASQ